MSEKNEESQLTVDERVKAILFQYVKLYDRWSEDRQEFNKNLAYQEELVKAFLDQVKQFEKLEPQVRQQLATSVSKASLLMSEKVAENVNVSATKAVDDTVNKLSKVVGHATTVLNAYRTEVEDNHWKIIIVSVISTLAASLLIVKLLMPDSTLPLTDEQIKTYQNGQLFNKIWPKLSTKEQKHLKELASSPMNLQNNNSINSIADSND